MNIRHYNTTSTLLLLVLLDYHGEIGPGLLSVGVNEIADGVNLIPGTLAAIGFFIINASRITAAPLLVLTDHHSKKYFIVFGLIGMGSSLITIANSHTPITTWISLCVWGISREVTIQTGEASIYEQLPNQSEKALSRFVFSGLLGDLFAPLILLTFTIIGSTWREAFSFSGYIVVPEESPKLLKVSQTQW